MDNWWFLVALFLLLVVYVIVNGSGMQSFKGAADDQKKIDEYRVRELRLTIWYNRSANSATVNLDDFERDGVAHITAFVTDPITNEVQRKAEGKVVIAGPAVVRCKHGTNEVVSWTYLKTK